MDSIFDSFWHWVYRCQFCILDSRLSSKYSQVKRDYIEPSTKLPFPFQICLTSGSVYLEYTAYFPSRSGSEVVFLEQTYPNPRYLFPTTFAVQSVILSYGSANATGKYFLKSAFATCTNTDHEIVMAKYLIAISGHTGTNWQIKGTALACYTIATLSRILPAQSF